MYIPKYECYKILICNKNVWTFSVTNILNVSYSDGSVPIDWDPEHGYPENLPILYYPRTAAGTGENLGFTIIFNLEEEDYYCSSSNGKGFKIFLMLKYIKYLPFH